MFKFISPGNDVSQFYLLVNFSGIDSNSFRFLQSNFKMTGHYFSSIQLSMKTSELTSSWEGVVPRCEEGSKAVRINELLASQSSSLLSVSLSLSRCRRFLFYPYLFDALNRDCSLLYKY